MNVADIITEFGAYYEQAGQNKNRILGMLTQGLKTPMYCTPVKTDDTIYRLASLQIGDLVQAFQKGWTPKSDIAFKPNELRLHHFKVDLEVTPDDVEAIWLGFLASDAVSRKDWPLIKFLIEHPEQGIIAAINRDMETKEYGQGVATDPTSGVAGVTGKTMNGLVTLLQAGVDAATMNSINIGTLDKDTIFDQVEAFVDGISEVYQNVSMNIHMSPQWAKYYHRDKRAQGFYTIASDAQIKNTIDFMPQMVEPLPSLSGTDVIFATPKVNMIHLTKKGENKNRFDLQESKRTVNILADWWEGIGFGMDGVVWTNLQAAGSGSGS
jgi:hypothetical protein